MCLGVTPLHGGGDAGLRFGGLLVPLGGPRLTPPLVTPLLVTPSGDGVAPGPLGDKAPEGPPGAIVEPYDDALEDSDARRPEGRIAGLHGAPLERVVTPVAEVVFGAVVLPCSPRPDDF